jgi:MFS family permease
MTRSSLGRDATLFLAASFISYLGAGIQAIAAAYLALESSGSVIAVGMVFLLMSLPQAVAAALSGVLVGRVGGRAIAVGADVFRAVAILAMPAGRAAGADPLSVVYGCSFLVALGNAVFEPAANAYVQSLVPRSQYSRYNARYEIAVQVSVLLSVAGGGFLVELVGVDTIFVLNSVTYLLSAALIFRMGRPRGAPLAASAPVTEVAGTTAPPATFLPLAALIALVQVIVAASTTLIVPTVLRYLGGSMGLLGLTDALAGLGMAAAGVAFPWLHRRLGGSPLVLGGFLVCAAFLASLPRGGLGWAMASTALNAIFFGWARIAARTLVYEEIPGRSMGRFFALAGSAGVVLSSVTTLWASYLAEHLGYRAAYLLLAGVIALVAAGAVAIRFLGSTLQPAPGRVP